jgi:hypothetical protein
MTTLPEYQEARERLEAWINAPGTDNETVCIRSTIATITAGDLRLLLAGPPVSREDVARAICDAEWAGSQPWDRKVESFKQRYLDIADAIAALYRGETK